MCLMNKSTINSRMRRNPRQFFASSGLMSALMMTIGVPSFAAAPPSPYPIFSDQTILKGVTIEAPLSDLFNATRALHRGQEIPKDKLPKGKVTFQGADGKSVTYE